MAAPGGTKALFTIVSNNYLPYARTLMASVREFSPEYRRVVVLADEIRGDLDYVREDFEVVPSSSLRIPNSRWFHFRYNILELNTAVKPYAFARLLESCETVIYLDPDIALYSDLEGIEDLLTRFSIVLTPHLLKSKPDDGRQPDELTILRSGSYNLGFIAVRAGPEAQRFVEWWCSRLYSYAYIDFDRGLFTDQRWIDMVPSIFDFVHISRAPQYNVAYWNLDERQVSLHNSGTYYVESHPLCFFHFSGFNPEDPLRLSKFQTRFTAGQLEPLRPLLTEYAERLIQNGYLEFRNISYSYGTFENGSPVIDICRRYADELPGVMEQVEDPFSEAGFLAFTEYWSAYFWRTDRPGRRLTRLAIRIHESRTDLRLQMPDPFGCDYSAIMEWLVTSGAQEYQLHPFLLDPLRKLLFAYRAGKVREADEAGLQLLYSVVSELPEVVRASVAQRIPEVRATRCLTRADLMAWLNEPEHAEDPIPLTRMAHLIYESRPDLQAAFPGVPHGDTLPFLRWCLTAGSVELGITHEFLSPLRAVFERYRMSLTASNRLSMTLIDAARHRLSVSRAIRRRDPPKQPDAASPPAEQAQSFIVPAIIAEGINVIGYVRSETGMGEVSRSLIAAAQAAAVPVSVCDFEVNNPARQQDFTVATIQNEFRYSVNVCAVNADQTSALIENLPGAAFRNKYNIGYWAWELEEFPDDQLSAFEHYDEIWTISAFCQDALSRKAPVPVIRMPLVVQPPPPSGNRLASDEFVFLTVFDLRSVFRRKNPLGAIEAFRLGSSGLPNSRLVLKVNNAAQYPAEMEELRKASEGLPVTIIEQVMTRAEVTGLIACCDCVLSLHRSEGFGLVLAEAMYLGKPVITTAYSGNLDFTEPGTAFLVGGRITEVGPGAEPYSPGSRWLEPDIPAAAEVLVAVRNDSRSRQRIAAAGQEYIHRNFSAAAVGEMMRNRLALIRRRVEKRAADLAHQ